jgi:hypothetical protein
MKHSAMSALRALLRTPTPVRPSTDLSPAVSSAMDAFMRAPIEAFAMAADDTASAVLRRAIAEGRDVLIIGCDPADVVVDGNGWSAEARIVLEGDRTRHAMMLTGAEGRMNGCSLLVKHGAQAA